MTSGAGDTRNETVTDVPLCGAQAWRIFTYEGLIVANTYRTINLACGFKRGHPGEHGQYMTVFTGNGQAKALVKW